MKVDYNHLTLTTRSLIGFYGVVNRLGLLESKILKKIFLSSYFFYKKFFDDPHYWLSKNYSGLFRDGHILDIGANIGFTASIFKNVLSEGSKVYCFEPEPNNFRELVKSIKENNATDKVVPIKAAVGETVGASFLRINEYHHGDHQIVPVNKNGNPDENRIEVPLLSIDKFFEQNELSGNPVSFIKIDVQGYELPVIRGMINTLDRNPGVIISIECDPIHLAEHGFNAESLIAEFEKLGFKYFYILNRRGGIHKLNSDLKKKALQKFGFFDMLCSKKSII